MKSPPATRSAGRGCALHVSDVDPRLAVGRRPRPAVLRRGQPAAERLQVHPLAAPRSRLSAYAIADRVLIDVEDHCGGLPAGDAERCSSRSRKARRRQERPRSRPVDRAPQRRGQRRDPAASATCPARVASSPSTFRRRPSERKKTKGALGQGALPCSTSQHCPQLRGRSSFPLAMCATELTNVVLTRMVHAWKPFSPFRLLYAYSPSGVSQGWRTSSRRSSAIRFALGDASPPDHPELPTGRIRVTPAACSSWATAS